MTGKKPTLTLYSGDMPQIFHYMMELQTAGVYDIRGYFSPGVFDDTPVLEIQRKDEKISIRGYHSIEDFLESEVNKLARNKTEARQK